MFQVLFHIQANPSQHYPGRSYVAMLQCHTSAVRFLLSGYITSPAWAQIPNMRYCIV